MVACDWNGQAPEILTGREDFFRWNRNTWRMSTRAVTVASLGEAEFRGGRLEAWALPNRGNNPSFLNAYPARSLFHTRIYGFRGSIALILASPISYEVSRWRRHPCQRCD